MESVMHRERRSRSLISNITLQPKRSSTFFLPQLCYSLRKMQFYSFWTLINVVLLVSSFGVIFVFNDGTYNSFCVYFIICCLDSIFFVSALVNFYMFLKYRKQYKVTCKSAAVEELGQQSCAFPKANNSRNLLRSRIFKRRNDELPINSFSYYEHDIIQFRIPKQGLSFPWESVLSHNFFPKDDSTDEIKNESTLSSDLTHVSETSFNKTWPSMKDNEMPLPRNYPLFNRRKEKYFISDMDEAKQLVRDFRKAVKDAPVSFCFHAGQSEKYMQFLPVPKDSGYRDFNDMWQRLVYQSSPINVKNNSNIEDSYVLPINHEVWRRFKLNPKTFVNWVANFRIWFAQTLLHSIIEEIDSVNNKLKTIVPAVSVGNVGLDELISTARNTMVTMNVPSLAVLLPYLQISTNQKYIVQRLRDLSLGNTMSDFSWKSGGKVDDKHWEPHLPCDAELVMHLIITYFDSRMPISIESPDRKPFSSYYFAKYPDPPPPSSDIVIYQQSTSPPHYQLIIKNETCHLPSGAYNMFFAVLLFMQYIKTYHNGVVGRMFLGQSGVNVLWTMEEVKVKTFS